MKTVPILILSAMLSIHLSAQKSESPNLLGLCTVNDLTSPPYSEWFSENYSSYTPNSKIIELLKSKDPSHYSVTIFFGTWCSDSQREVPRLLKILDALSLRPQIIALGNGGKEDSLYRQSPNHEEAGKHIYRVPTFIISKDGRELGRIIEYPAVSLERDILDILNSAYTPSLASCSLLASWLEEGILDDVNVSFAGLAGRLRPMVSSAGELNSIANTLQRREKVSPRIAETLLRINNILYPAIYWTYTRLAEALSNNEGKHDAAVEVLNEGLEHIKDPADQKRIQDVLDSILAKM
ncbi:MAG: thioredoxin family protein [Tannerellaceae bacterium]|jgi:thiol-disulfide isomerase/thioredoxin|nr:thioredoxin family protein [Tannerellaceae bacterium]